VLHDEAELVGDVVPHDAAEADDVRVAAARLEEAGLPQHLLGVGGRVLIARVAEGLDGDDLAGGTVPPFVDDAEHALAQAGLVIVVPGGSGDAPLLGAGCSRPVGVAVDGGGRSLGGGHRVDPRAQQSFQRQGSGEARRI
uniref:Uncharacterized protein n=1 Tax=Triticum urartu TaxID=4572 RepID=A0A8R7PPN2_TRIUA